MFWVEEVSTGMMKLMLPKSNFINLISKYFSDPDRINANRKVEHNLNNKMMERRLSVLIQESV